MGAEYVRSYYKVPAKRGMRVHVDNKPGMITGYRGQYILVRFDDPHVKGVWPCHPTWMITYFTPSGPVMFT